MYEIIVGDGIEDRTRLFLLPPWKCIQARDQVVYYVYVHKGRSTLKCLMKNTIHVKTLESIRTSTILRTMQGKYHRGF